MLPRVTKRSLSYYLRVWRAEHNLSQVAAADIFGISRSYLSLIEHGKRTPSAELAEAISVATGCPFRIALGLEKGEELPQ